MCFIGPGRVFSGGLSAPIPLGIGASALKIHRSQPLLRDSGTCRWQAPARKYDDSEVFRWKSSSQNVKIPHSLPRTARVRPMPVSRAHLSPRVRTLPTRSTSPANAARAPRPRPLPSRTPPRRASRLRVRAARARIRTALHPRTVRLPHRAPRASAADAVQRARSILR